MKKDKKKLEKKKVYIKATSDFRCGLSRASQLEAFKRGFFNK